MTAIGHNSNAATDRLRSLVERIENLENERRDLAAAVKDIYTEAKSAGYDTKVLRALIAERRKDAADVAEHEALLDTYRRALAGMEGLPLADAALARVGK